MRARTGMTWSFLGLTALGAAVSGPELAAVAAPQSSALFRDAPGAGTFDLAPARESAADPTVMRSRRVTVDYTALGDASAPAHLLTGRSTLLLNLFDDAIFSAVVDRVEPANGGFTWVGRIPAIDLSTVTLATVDGVTVGHVITPAAVYSIEYVGAGINEVRQVDPSRFAPEAEPLPVNAGPADQGGAVSGAAPRPEADSGSTIDVMILYTPAAVAAAGGAAAMSAKVNVAVADANTSYGNSGITQHLQLVYSQQVDYVEDTTNGISGDLSTLRNGTGALSGVPALRNTYAADIVTLLTSNTKDLSVYCGMGYLMTSVSTSFASYAFNVVQQNCAASLTYAHELGHNMGANHDWYMNHSVLPYTYAHGYIDTTARWRTIMSYNDLCSVQGFTCTRLTYWANPGLTYNGAPMGIAGGTRSNCPTGSTTDYLCDADDHLTLNNTAYTVANFRASGPSSAPVIATQPVSQTAATGSVVTFAAGATGSPAPTVQWQVSTNGGSTWTNISGATSATYAFTAATTDNGKQYRAVFTNSMGTAASNAAVLTVRAWTTKIAPAMGTVGLGATVTLRWAELPGAGYSVCWDATNNNACDGAWWPGGSATTRVLTGLAAGTHYWQVRAETAAGSSEADEGTWWRFTVGALPPFTDDPLAVRGTVVKAVHLTELRQAIGTLRTRFSLGTFTWTDATIVARGTPVKAVHLTELRTALNAVYTAAARTAPTYTHATVTGRATAITALDIAELRAAILAIW